MVPTLWHFIGSSEVSLNNCYKLIIKLPDNFKTMTKKKVRALDESTYKELTHYQGEIKVFSRPHTPQTLW